MKIVALVEVHPLSGEPSFITARFESMYGEFDMPLSSEQAELVLKHSAPISEEPSEEMLEKDAQEEFNHSPVAPRSQNSFPIDVDPDALILKATQEPTPYFDTNEDYYDDEL